VPVASLQTTIGGVIFSGGAVSQYAGREERFLTRKESEREERSFAPPPHIYTPAVYDSFSKVARMTYCSSIRSQRQTVT